ncbi:MAG: PhoH family protein [Erysipelotrichaceae bacterium]|nr:PhoH family protein [Erysipelotrichaceae bacterium]
MLLGENDEYLHYIEEYFQVSIMNRGNYFAITGEQRSKAKATILALVKIMSKQELTKQEVHEACGMADRMEDERVDRIYESALAKNIAGKLIYPKTYGQKQYVSALMNHDIVFGVGPAGTGKTYLAVVYAVSLLKKNEIRRIVLTRPAVEAGESLGFLPGDLKEKVDPYLRPLYDALYEMLGEETTTKMIEKGTIEIAPLAYMRGRTLNGAFIILDEAQNTTKSQMKMFLTRLGFNSKMVITGDISQIDLPSGKQSGLVEAIKILNDIDAIKVCRFTTEDVVRHPLVSKIIRAYERNENR